MILIIVILKTRSVSILLPMRLPNLFSPQEEASPSNSELSSKDFALPSLECLPSSDQRISAKLAITTLEDSVHILDSQAEETAIKLGRINNQRKTQMDRLLLFRAFLAPIRRLPMEVLGEIFLISVLELKKSPWDLAHVSKSFRVAAFVTRRVRIRFS